MEKNFNQVDAPTHLVRKLLVLMVVCCMCSSPVTAISCLPCKPNECPQLNSTSCPYGIGMDYCMCCNTCLKGPGESCGDIFGQCFNGSRCIVELEFGSSYFKYINAKGKCKGIAPPSDQPDPSSQPPLPSPTTTSSITVTQLTATTIHTKSLQMTSLPLSVLHSTITITSTVMPTTTNCDYPSASPTLATPTSTPVVVVEKKKDKCRTPCSKEFCNDGLNRYCSSNSTFSKPRNIVTERIPCQHTTCLACKFVIRPKCPTCPVPVNKRCLRHFELCLDEHYKRTDIFLEMTDPRIANMEGEIVCDVPELYLPEDEGSGDT